MTAEHQVYVVIKPFRDESATSWKNTQMNKRPICLNGHLSTIAKTQTCRWLDQGKRKGSDFFFQNEVEKGQWTDACVI